MDSKKTKQNKRCIPQDKHYLVKKYDTICMEDLDIQKIFQEKNLSSSLQTIGWRKLVDMIKYKCEWYGKNFIQISRWFPSSKNCSNCGYYNKDLKDQKEWTCPSCKKTRDRDINAAKNIQKQGLIDEIMNFWNRWDSTVILLSIESTNP